MLVYTTLNINSENVFYNVKLMSLNYLTGEDTQFDDDIKLYHGLFYIDNNWGISNET